MWWVGIVVLIGPNECTKTHDWTIQNIHRCHAIFMSDGHVGCHVAIMSYRHVKIRYLHRFWFRLLSLSRLFGLRYRCIHGAVYQGRLDWSIANTLSRAFRLFPTPSLGIEVRWTSGTYIYPCRQVSSFIMWSRHLDQKKESANLAYPGLFSIDLDKTTWADPRKWPTW